MTILEAINAYATESAEQGRRSKAWRSFAREVATGWGKDSELLLITEESVQDWVADLVARGNAVQTIAGKVSFIDALLRFGGRRLSPACRRAILDATKEQGRPQFLRGPRILTDKELTALRKALAPGDWDVFTLGMKTGMTTLELFTRRFVDLNFTAGLIKVHKDARGEIREVPMVKDVRRILAKAAKSSKSRKAYAVTPRGYGHWANRQAIANHWKFHVLGTALKEAKISDFSWRDLRGMAAMKMAESGIPRTVIAEVFGHKSCRQIEKYINPHQKLLARAMAVL